MLTPIQGVDPRIAMKATATQLSALKLFADSNGDIIAHSGVKVGSFTRDVSLATGTQAITGVGFKPSAIVFLTSGQGAGNIASWGFDDRVVHEHVSVQGNQLDNYYQDTSNSIVYGVNISVDYYLGVIATLDNDGFTIQWTKVGNPTGTAYVKYMAFR